MRLLLALFASAVAISAQTSAPAPAGPQTARAQEPLQQQEAKMQVSLLGSASSGCPVAFSARRYPNGGLVQTDRRPGAHRLEYDVSFGRSLQHPLAVTSARITLHGLDGARVLPVTGDDTGLATEDFSLQPTRAQERGFHSVIYVRRLTGVQTIELNELTFADGTQWHESAEDPCRISPNGFTPISLSGR